MPASERLKAGMTLRGTLTMVERLRQHDAATPIVLMGYYNPIYRYGAEAFARMRSRPGSTASSSSTCRPRKLTN